MKKVLLKAIHFSTITYITLLLITFSLYAEDTDVLVLNSYHQGFHWTDEMVKGIMDVLNTSDKSIEYYIEYMDSKRHPLTDATQANLAERLTLFYNNIDIIITTDNNALDFLLKYNMFPDVPIVFGGYNTPGNQPNDFDPRVRGIVEYPRLAPTLDLISEIQPYVKQIGIITDGSLTGKNNLAIISKDMDRYRDQFDFVIYNTLQYTLDELIEEISGLTRETALFYVDFFYDKNGKYLNADHTIPYVSEHSPVPVYTPVDIFIWTGPVGGAQNVGKEHGKLAAKMALEELGLKEKTMPDIISHSPMTVVLDYTELKRFNIPLPGSHKGYLLINKPESVFLHYQKLFYTLFLLLLFIIVFLIVHSIFMNKVNSKLNERRKQFEAIYEGVAEALFILDLSGTIKDCNGRANVILGLDTDSLAGHRLNEFISDFDPSLIQDRDYEFFRENGKVVSISLTKKNITINEEMYLLLTMRDVTENRNHQKEMVRSLEEKNILLQEIHHRVKNNLNVICGLLSLQAANIRNKHDAKKAFEESINRIYSMAVIHEKFYKSRDFVEINLDEFVTDILEEQRSYIINKNINFHLDIETITLDINKAVPCGLIINEILSNAFKHAFPDERKGNIYISIKRTTDRQDSCTIEISDDGVGFDYKPYNENSDSLGLTLIEMLALQLQGTLSIETSRGTSIRLTSLQTSLARA